MYDDSFHADPVDPWCELFVDPQYLRDAPEVHGVVARAAGRSLERQGLAVGEFLRHASHGDLIEVSVLAHNAKRDPRSRQSLIFLTLLLANGEAMPIAGGGDLVPLVQRVLWLIEAEQLQRQGLLSIRYERLSLEDFHPGTLSLTLTGRRNLGGTGDGVRG